MNFNRASFVVLTASLAFSLIACESKFVEPSPNEEKVEGMQLDERVSKKTDLDARQKEIQRSAEKIKNILNMFKKVQNPTYGQDVYTPIDLLIDINKELENKIPESKPETKTETLVRFGKIDVPIDLLSKECRRVDVMTESTTTYTDKDPKNPEISKQVVSYFMKTCGSGGQFIEILTSETTGNKMDFKFFNKNLESVWDQVVFTDKLEDSACKVNHDADKILQTVDCRDFYVQLSVSERAHVKKLNFSNIDDPRFFTLADIYENGVLKATTKMTVSREGEVSVDVKKAK